MKKSSLLPHLFLTNSPDFTRLWKACVFHSFITSILATELSEVLYIVTLAYF